MIAQEGLTVTSHILVRPKMSGKLLLEGFNDTQVSDGEGEAIEIIKSYPGVVGHAKMLWLAGYVLRVIGMECDAKMGISMFDRAEITADLYIDAQFLYDLSLQCLLTGFKLIYLSTGKLPQPAKHTVQRAAAYQELPVFGNLRAPDDAGNDIKVRRAFPGWADRTFKMSAAFT